MPFNIHFRGVAVFTTKDKFIREVLFPNAETQQPPEGGKEKLRDSAGRVIGTVMHHADRSPAPKHYAGALIVGNGGAITYRKLLGCEVSVATGNNGARFTGNPVKDPPPLSEAITNPEYAIRLLDKTQRNDPRVVATRFILDGGEAFPEQGAQVAWELDGGKRGKKHGPREYDAGLRWQVPATGPNPRLELQVKTLSGDRLESIILTKDRDTVYFYNFDAGLPTVDDLTKPEIVDPDYPIDHDFKWVYALFKHSKASWSEWLDDGFPGRDEFPAPRRVGEPLIPVSTCFPTVWPDE